MPKRLVSKKFLSPSTSTQVTYQATFRAQVSRWFDDHPGIFVLLMLIGITAISIGMFYLLGLALPVAYAAQQNKAKEPLPGLSLWHPPYDSRELMHFTLSSPESISGSRELTTTSASSQLISSEPSEITFASSRVNAETSSAHSSSSILPTSLDIGLTVDPLIEDIPELNYQLAHKKALLFQCIENIRAGRTSISQQLFDILVQRGLSIHFKLSDEKAAENTLGNVIGYVSMDSPLIIHIEIIPGASGNTLRSFEFMLQNELHHVMIAYINDNCIYKNTENQHLCFFPVLDENNSMDFKYLPAALYNIIGITDKRVEELEKIYQKIRSKQLLENLSAKEKVLIKKVIKYSKNIDSIFSESVTSRLSYEEQNSLRAIYYNKKQTLLDIICHKEFIYQAYYGKDNDKEIDPKSKEIIQMINDEYQPLSYKLPFGSLYFDDMIADYERIAGSLNITQASLAHPVLLPKFLITKGIHPDHKDMFIPHVFNIIGYEKKDGMVVLEYGHINNCEGFFYDYGLRQFYTSPDRYYGKSIQSFIAKDLDEGLKKLILHLNLLAERSSDFQSLFTSRKLLTEIAPEWLKYMLEYFNLHDSSIHATKQSLPSSSSTLFHKADTSSSEEATSLERALEETCCLT